MKNLFKQALQKGELAQFALGKGEYFIVDREYGEHWVLGSWLNHIIPFCEENFKECASALDTMFQEIICRKTNNLTEKIENLLYHTYVYYYLSTEGSIKNLKGVVEKWEQQIIYEIQNYKKQQLSSKKLAEVDTSVQMIQIKGGLKNISIE